MDRIKAGRIFRMKNLRFKISDFRFEMLFILPILSPHPVHPVNPR
jgi:hypothetical protein